jgi:anti-anti-sigma regulatory factor
MIVLDEDIGIKKVREFYNDLKEELSSGNEVVVDFSKVGRTDLSVIQVIIAAGREAKSKGKTIRLKKVSRDMKLQMQLCGLKT